MNVTVHRQKRLRDWGAKYAINVDGETMGTVKSGRSVSFDVEPGNHTIQCQLQVLYLSRLVQFTVADTPVDFECAPRLGTFATPFTNLNDTDEHIILRERT